MLTRLLRHIVRVFVHLLPARVRQRQGAQVERTLETRLDAARASGRLAAARVAATECADLTASAVRERFGTDPLQGEAAPPASSLPRRAAAALMTDVRFATRLLVRQPAFTAASVLTLALGIGANVAVFSVVWHVMLAPAPYRNADQLTRVFMTSATVNRGSFSPLDLRDLAAESRTIADLAYYQRATRNLTGAGDPQRLTGAAVTGNFFRALDLVPVAGRWLTDDDAAAGGRAVVLSYGLWQRQFGASADVVGQSITLNNEPITVIGVMPDGANLPEEAEFWTPIVWEDGDFEPNQRGARYLRAIARLRPGVTIEQATADVEAIGQRLAAEYPKTNQGASMTLVGLRDAEVESVRPSLVALSAAVVLVLLIACGNLANLSLTRGLGRAGEVAVRASLGASRWRLVSQFLVEGLVLSAAGAAVAVLLAFWGIRSIVLLVPEGLPRLQTVTIDWPVLAFLGGVTVLSALVFGLAPAWHASRVQVARLVREGGTRSVTRGHGLRRALAIGEVALAVMLVGTAGLLGRTLLELARIDPGFDPARTLTFNITLPGTPYDTGARRAQLFNRVVEEARSLPGVESAALGFGVPFGAYNATSSFNIEGIPTPDDEEFMANLRVVGPGYFQTLGIPIVAGRPIDARDAEDGLLVCVISESTARQYFGAEDPVGRQLRVHVSMASDAPRGNRTVIGVAGDVRVRDLSDDPAPEIYVPYSQHAVGSATIVMKTAGDPLLSVPLMRARLRAIDASLPMASVRPLETLVRNSTARQRLAAALLAVFAVVAVSLASVGLYGVFSVGVSQRTREIGIRMALGADRARVLTLFVREGLTLTAVGSVLGVAGALAAASLTESLLVGVSARDPLTLALAWLVLTVVSLAACYLPARRASRTNAADVLQRI
jgi:predicted permease